MLLLHRLVALLHLAVWTMLWFGGMVAALETYFLAPDVDFLASQPVRRSSVLHYKFARTYALSAWMVFLLLLPTLHGYARTVGGKVGFTALMLPVIFLATIPPVALSAAATVALMRVLPVDRAKEIVFAAGALVSLLFVGLVRFLSPRYLFDQALFDDFLGYVQRFRAPGSPWLPSNLATEATMAAAPQRWRDYLPAVGALAAIAAASYAAAHLLCLRLFATDRPRARAAFDLPPWETRLGLTRAVDLAVRPVIWPAARALVAKELKTHMRDPTQISHLVLLAAVLLLHLVNLREIPAEFLTVPARNLLAFLNLSLVGFLAAAVAVRFVYPAVSLEGRAVWIVEQAPVRPAVLLGVKAAATGGPLVIASLGALALVQASIGLGAAMTVLTSVAAVAIVGTVALMAAAFGAQYPRFETTNVFEISSGMGGISFMVTALVYVCASIAILAVPAFGITFVEGWWATRPVVTAAAIWAGLHAIAVPAFVAWARAGIENLSERFR